MLIGFAGSLLTALDLSLTDIVNIIFEIAAILQTLQTLIKQLSQLCLLSIIRFMFSILFYFTPHLNPFTWVDAYEQVMKHREAQKRAAEEEKKDAVQSKTSGRESVPGSGVDGSFEMDMRELSDREHDARPAL